jgi:hypothetical protein
MIMGGEVEAIIRTMKEIGINTVDNDGIAVFFVK